MMTSQLDVNVGVLRRKRRRRELSGQICTACDQCYRCKVKCSGERPACERCLSNKSACTYSTGKPLGKPKGSKNKIQRSKSVPGLVTTPRTILSGRPSHAYSEHNSTLSKVPLLSISPPTTMSNASSPMEEKPALPLFANTSVHHGFTQETKSAITPTMQTTFDAHYGQPSIENVAGPQNACGNGLFLYTDPAPHTGSLNWLGSNENYIITSPDEMAVNDWMSQSSIDTSAQPSMSMTPSENIELSMIGHAPSIHSTTPCLCDPVALGIISELQSVQQAESRIDTVLILARRGFSIVSACLACAACHSSSSSIFFACVLIIQQIFTCYGSLRVQGLKMLNAISLGVDVKGEQPCIGVGDFNVEDGEGCFGILNAIVKVEMERSKGVLGGLEVWAARCKAGEQKMARLLLRTLKDELGC